MTEVNVPNPETAQAAPSPVVTTEAQPAPAAITPPPEPVVTEATPAVVTATPEPTPAETKTETVLGDNPDKPVEPVEPKAPETAEIKNEGGQSDEPAPPPTYDPWTLPEGIKLDDTKVGEFTNLLAELETSGKASHEAVQAFGQKAVEFYLNEQKNVVDNIQKYYQTVWEKQKLEWKDQFLADPDIGGNRFQTTVDAANTFIRTHGGTPEQQAELRKDLESSGLGNKLSVIRIFAAAGEAMKEGRPLAAQKPVSAPKSKLQTMYGNNAA